MDAMEFAGNLIALLEGCIAEKEKTILEDNKKIGHASINGIDEEEDILAMFDYVISMRESNAAIQAYEEIRGLVEGLLVDYENVWFCETDVQFDFIKSKFYRVFVGLEN